MKTILILGEDEVIEQTAKKFKSLRVVKNWSLNDEVVGDVNLIVEPGIRIPWDLLPAAWNFLVRWDAAVPLWLYGKLAEDVGSESDRKAAKSVIRDLRVLLHEPGLLFVKKSPDGVRLIEEYADARKRVDDKRLAFLTAIYRVKPKLCYLPRTWLKGTTIPGGTGQPVRGVASRRGRPSPKQMVVVEVSTGKFVKVHAGDEEKAIAMYQEKKLRGG